MDIVAVANQKGGVGKTTTVVSLAGALARRGARVLCVDLDPQMALTGWMVGEESGADSSVYDALWDPGKFTGAIAGTDEGFDVAVSSSDLAGAELELWGADDHHRRVAKAMTNVAQRYEWGLVDCPPSLGLLTMNALMAAKWVLIPVSCEYLALRGLAMLLTAVRRVQEGLNPRLKIIGILPTLYEARTLHAQEVVDALRDRFGDLIFPPIKRTVRFREAPVARRSIIAYAPRSKGALAYTKIAEEVICRVQTGFAEGERGSQGT